MRNLQRLLLFEVQAEPWESMGSYRTGMRKGSVARQASLLRPCAMKTVAMFVYRAPHD